MDPALRHLLHYGLHCGLPVLLALAFWRDRWKQATLFLWLTMLVDLDHLLADPVYMPCRCSIGFHPLHTLPAIAVYAAGLLPSRTRIWAVGLLLHMGTDWLDCRLSLLTCG